MVQPINNNINKPIYNAVKINISKPEVNKGENSVVDDNGIYNAVNIDIDNPAVNTVQKKIYDYPVATNPITYDMAYINPIALPTGFHVAYQTTNVIMPEIENEFEQNFDELEADAEEDKMVTDTEAKDDASATVGTEEDGNDIVPPEPNYTTLENEKSVVTFEKNFTEEPDLKEIADTVSENEKAVETDVSNDVNFKAAQEVKRPEIIPATEIKPEVDVPLILSNLSNPDYDIQAQQMEEIARISLDNPANAVPYIVREIYASLIHITKADTSKLAAPTEEQIEARKKIITNVLSLANQGGQTKDAIMPYDISDKEIALANTISPMEQAERNKEYALYTMACLTKVYTDEVEKQTGNIVPMTDLPGVSSMVDALRYSPNAGVKIAAINSLEYISRPEYKEELNTIFSLAQADNNIQVSQTATEALKSLNNK